jgi:hypothetical protein
MLSGVALRRALKSTDGRHWAVSSDDGQWRTTGSIEFWKGRTQTQSPLSSGLQDWWYYAPEIGQPQPGETVGVFYAAGDQRRKDVRTVEERTNIVTFVVPPNDTGTFSFAAVPPVITPPVVTPPPPSPPLPAPPPIIVTVPPPAAPPDLSGVTTRLDALAQQLAAHEAEDKAFRDETSRIYKGTLKFLVERVAPVVGGILATWQMSKP